MVAHAYRPIANWGAARVRSVLDLAHKHDKGTDFWNGEEVDIVLCVILLMYSRFSYLHCHERKHRVRMAAVAAWKDMQI